MTPNQRENAVQWLRSLQNTPLNLPYFSNGMFVADCQNLVTLLTAMPVQDPVIKNAKCPACGEKAANLWALYVCRECEGEFLGDHCHLSQSAPIEAISTVLADKYVEIATWLAEVRDEQ